MKLSATLLACILALAPIAGAPIAQARTPEQVVQSAKCPEGQKWDAKKRKCDGEATTIKDGGSTTSGKPSTTDTGSAQSAEPVTVSGGTSTQDSSNAAQQCADAGGMWTAGVCTSAEKQCIDAGGTWTSDVCTSAEKQCIDAGGTWTSGVCLKE